MEFITQYWIEVLFGLIIAGVGCGMKKLFNKINEQESVKMGLQALLRDRIIQAYNVYQEKGFCPIYARESIDELVKQYHNLGGNGVITDLFEKIKSLPTELHGNNGEE